MRTLYAYTICMKANKLNILTKKEWDKIRFEYISGNDTVRGLARKYKIAPSTISTRASREGWKEDAKKVEQAAAGSTIQKAVEARGSNQEKALSIIDTLLDKMQVAVSLLDKRDVQGMKSMVQSMKDLKELGVFETDDKETVITVKFEGGEDLAD